MATSPSLSRVNPFIIYIGLILGATLLFTLSVGTVLYFSYSENERILKYELQTILKGNGPLLQGGNLRQFVDKLPQENNNYTFEAYNHMTGQKFKTGILTSSIAPQCTFEKFLQYEIQFCRPFLIPWKIIFTFTFFTLMSFLIFLLFAIKATKLAVLEFKELFIIANIPYPDDLNFSKAWGIAQKMAHLFKKYQQESIQLERQKASMHVASQVAHDIRSPLSALNMILGQLEMLPENSRILIRSSVNRVNDIANNLLNHGKNQVSESQNYKPHRETIMLASIIDNVVSEKRILLRQNLNVNIEARLKKSYGLFANVDPVEMKRLLSNAIGNSAEAFKKNYKGVIELILEPTPNSIILTVKDNGRGIPPHILAKLGERGVTHGKEGTQSGSGLGVHHAKTTIESFGGKYEIQSTLGVGTSVVITLKREEPPAWFVQSLRVKENQYVVATDDDSSILEIWHQRFSGMKIHLVTCASGNTLRDWIEQNPFDSQNAIYLMDYELLGQRQNGLDLVESLNLGQKAILVSSRYEETQIKKKCADLNVRMIPKGLASLVPIEIEKHELTHDKHFINEISINTLINEAEDQKSHLGEKAFLSKNRYDLCLIDDDRHLIHAVWGMVANQKNLNIKMFSSPEEFFTVAGEIDPQTPIYVDVSLGNGISGVDVARDIHQLGFIEINLATGYDADTIDAPTFVHKIVGKDFPL